MTFLKEADALKSQLFSWLVSFLVSTIALFSVGLGKVVVFGREIYVPVFSQHSLVAIFFQAIEKSLIPKDVILVATSPLSVFVSQMKIAVIGALIITFPLLAYKIFRFASPALYEREKKAALILLIPSTILFAGGALFAYLVLIPPTFKFLYSFNTALGVAPFFAIDEFIGWTLAAMFATGVLFLLPVFMYLLSRLEIVPAYFWRTQWRVSLVVFLIISALITPDPSGITMFFVAVPMLVLYGVGVVLSARLGNR